MGKVEKKVNLGVLGMSPYFSRRVPHHAWTNLWMSKDVHDIFALVINLLEIN